MTFRGGAGLGAAQGRVLIDMSQLQHARSMSRQAGADIERNLGRINTGAVQAQRGIQGLAGSIVAVRQVLGAFGVTLGAVGVTQLGRFSNEAARASAQLGGLMQEFDNLTAGISGNSEEMLDAMRRASWGLIDDMSLVINANRAMLFGVAESVEDMEKLMQIASARAAAMGISTEQALDDLVRGIGRLNPQILENLGFTISAIDAYERFAEANNVTVDSLSEVERRQALLNIAYAEAEDLILRQQEAGETNQGTLERSATAATNARIAFGALIEEDMVQAARNYGDALEYVTDKLHEWADARSRANRAAGLQHETPEALRYLSPDALDRLEGIRAERSVPDSTQMMERFREQIVAIRQETSALENALDSAMGTGQDHVVAELTRRIDENEVAVSRLVATYERLAVVSDRDLRIQAGIIAPDIPDMPTPFLRDPRTPGMLAPHSGVSRGPTIDSEALGAAQVEFWQSANRIENRAYQARLASIEQHNEAVSSAQRRYSVTMAREAEDFHRQRARQVADHERSIADIRSAAVEREAAAAVTLGERIASMRQDVALRQADAIADHNERQAQQTAEHNERMTNLREQGAERITQIEESVQRAREQAQARHRDTLISAAANLDARAVAEEIRRFDREEQERERAGQERIDQERENLDDRLAQEAEQFEKRRSQEQAQFDKRLERENRDLQRRIDAEQAAHEKRLQQAREADEQRIEEEKAAFDERLAQEDEDRAIRLERQSEDHDAQIQQLERAQRDRLAQIDRQQNEQRAELEESFGRQLAELGLHNVAWENEQRRRQRESLTLWKDYWDDWHETMEDAMADRPQFGPPEAPDPPPDDFHDPETSIFGQPSKPWETPSWIGPPVIQPSRSMEMDSVIQPNNVTNNSRHITVAAGAVQVQALPGMDEAMLGDRFREQLLEVLREIE